MTFIFLKFDEKVSFLDSSLKKSFSKSKPLAFKKSTILISSLPLGHAIIRSDLFIIFFS